MEDNQSHPIFQRLSAKRHERVRLRRSLEIVEAEIRAYEDAWRLVNAPVAETAPEDANEGERRERALAPQWADMLRFIGERGKASLNDLMAYAADKEHGINRNTLRSQVSIYSERGWLDRVEVGTFRLTEAGAAKCGFDPALVFVVPGDGTASVKSELTEPQTELSSSAPNTPAPPVSRAAASVNARIYDHFRAGAHPDKPLLFGGTAMGLATSSPGNGALIFGGLGKSGKKV